VGLRMSIPLPGPFSYSVRLGGKRRRRPSEAQRRREAAARATAKLESRLRVAEREGRRRRGAVTECRVNAVTGGSFTVVTEDGNMTINLDTSTAPRFLSLRDGDAVIVTLSKARDGIEHFEHVCRANGAIPRRKAG